MTARIWVWVALYVVLVLAGLYYGSSAFAVLMGVAIPIYCLPGIIAARRGHPDQQSIAAINVFLGWTLLGWVVALAWALKAIPAR